MILLEFPVGEFPIRGSLFRMPKILHVIQILTLGGAARALVATAKCSARSGTYTPSILSILPAEGRAHQMALDSGIRVISGPTRTLLEAELSEADIVQMHWWNVPEITDFIRSALPPMRLMFFYHVAGDRVPHLITPALLDFADMNVPCNPYTYYDTPIFRDMEAERKFQHAGLVYGAADFSRIQGFKHRPHTGFKIGYIGTIDFIKMHPDYVRMSAAIKIPDVKFIICGEGSLEVLRGQVRELGATDRFEFRGYVENVREVMEEFDLYGYPLCEETYAGSELNLQEVMYAGFAPVVFPYGGVKRLVINDFTGLIVHSTGEYKEAVEYLYRNPAERQRMGINARSYAQQIFGAENAAVKINSLYAKMLERPKRSRHWPTAKATGSDGARIFIDTLGDQAGAFKVSREGGALPVVWKAEAEISHANRLLFVSGIMAYRERYPTDPFLRFWAGLAFSAMGWHGEAALEFVEAIKTGFPHWRARWWLRQSTLALGKQELADGVTAFLDREVPGYQDELKFLEPERGNTPQVSPEATLPTPEISGIRLEKSAPFLPKVSAIVSVYQAEEFMQGCLQDLVEQTLFLKGELEIVVIDSGSSQGEHNIVKDFQSKFSGIQYLRTERESIYSAWNRAVTISRGEYLVNANADDRHSHNAFERMAATLDARMEGLVYVDALLTKRKNETMTSHSATSVWVMPDFNARQVLVDCPFGCTVMWRKSLHNSLGFFDGSYKIAGDYEFFLKASLSAGAFHLAEPLALYYESPKSLSYSDPSGIAKEITRFLPGYRRTLPMEKIYPYLEKDHSSRALSLAHTDLGIQFIHPLSLIEPEAAEFHFRKALELDASAPESVLNLIIALEEQHKTSEANRLMLGLDAHQAATFIRLKAAVANKPGSKVLFALPHPGIESLPAIVHGANCRVSLQDYRPAVLHQK